MHRSKATSERRLSALPVSRGIGIGRVVFLHGNKRQFFRIDLSPGQVKAEIARFRAAVEQAVSQLRDLSLSGGQDPNHSVSGIFGVHLLIIEQSSLIEKIETVMRTRRINAEWALKMVSDEYVEKQMSVADGNFREKHLDIADVVERLMAALLGSPSKAQTEYSGAVVVARELWPSAIMELAKSKPAALITERGGWTSHTSIIARDLKLPMASGIRDLAHTFTHGDQVIVDGDEGQVIVNPETTTLEYFRGISTQNSENGNSVSAVTRALHTLDGTPIAVRANVDLPAGYLKAKALGARGIGLFRSESLIGNSGEIPSEEEQVEVYRRIGDAVDDDRVRIRTFDIGHHHRDEGPSSEGNPALGLRSIRLSLSKTDDFRAQIRALLRASADRGVDIVLPMISGVGEIQQSKAILHEEREGLERREIPIGNPQLGAMIEVPSAVLTTPEIAREVDFLCLGTNDLVQYLLAVDRDNDAVSAWYQTLHPAVIRAISQVLEAAKIESVPVTVCGEMAGSPFYVPVLIGLGATDLSMNVNSIPQVRRVVAGITVAETAALIGLIKMSETPHETESLLSNFYKENWSSLFPPGLLNSKHR